MPPISQSAVSASAPIARRRGTQSFVHILAACWHRPSLLGLELLWRWLFGIPLLALLFLIGQRIWNQTAAQVRSTGIFDFSLQFPMNGALAVAEAWQILRGPILHAAAWLLPLAIVAWSIAAGLGRNAVLRRYAPHLPWRPGVSIALQLLRILALCAAVALWFVCIQAAANFALAGTSPDAGPNAIASEPNLVLYCALVIVLSLGIFVLWALLSWIFSIAPLLAILERRSIPATLARSARLGPLTGKLVEINLVMGIVKIALIVLAMVFSATPLPFESVVNGPALYAWWGLVTLLYLIASDFFQVARIAAFVELYEATSPSPIPSPPANS
ncbi:MAG TPA: hypothetical protein VKT75_20585 [Acidobacteriaceae bacterium]|nr:hypothetical protein [Acidobacteriaceae bacterium]